MDKLRLDYALLIDDRLVGAVEVHERMSEAVAHYADQLSRLLAGASRGLDNAPPVVYFSNGRETLVLPGPVDEPREVATFHSPAALAAPSQLGRLAREVANLPSGTSSRLRPVQTEAVQALEASITRGDRRALVALPQGSGRSAVVFETTTRLFAHTSARRVLVLVDRLAVAQQLATGMSEWGGEGTAKLRVEVGDTKQLPADAQVVVLTAQRAELMLRAQTPPVDRFDFIWALDPERLTGTQWQAALDYFDAPLVGITTSPTPEVYAYFDGNLVASFDAAELLAQHGSAGGPNTEVLTELYGRASRYRDELPLDDAVARALRESNLALGWRDLIALTQRLGRTGFLTPEAFVLEFLAAYLRGREAEWAVDPYVSNPALLAAVVEAGGAKRALGMVPNSVMLELAESLHADETLTWTARNLIHEPDGDGALGHPGLIVSAPPFGLKRPQEPVKLADGRLLDVRDDGGERLMLQTAADLDETGEAVFLVTDSFFRGGPRSVRALLPKAGLHVQAVVAVRDGFNVSVATSFVFIRREPTDTVFVGELSADIDQAQLVSLLQRRRRGPVPALGRLVPWSEFRGFAELAAEERLETLLAESLGERRQLADVLDGPVVRPKKEEDFEPAPNAVYLPSFAGSLVHAGRTQLTSKPWGYFQLPLDPDKALAEYVAALLNSPVGRALRESISSGGVHPSISRRRLDELQLPLPAIAVQREVVAARSRIRGLRLELEGLERQLTTDPTSSPRVQEALDDLGHRDPLTTFRESLPFPLASILWRYEADADPKDKVAHLHGFFEASAIYFATVLLSAFMRDDEVYREERRTWFKKLRRNSFNRSSFGTWTLFAQKMAASARRKLDDADERPRMLRAFAVGSERFIDAVVNAELWDLLDEAKEVRNQEKAHAGIAGAAQHEETHAQLLPLLTQLGELLGPVLDDVVLIRPGAGRRRRGVTYYDRAERLQGPQSIFKQVPVSTSENPALEDSELYLLSATEQPAQAALHLEPFVRLKHAPPSAQDACYFYAKLQSDGEVEFVSHHYEGKPRLVELDDDVVQLVAALQAEDEPAGD